MMHNRGERTISVRCRKTGSGSFDISSRMMSILLMLTLIVTFFSMIPDMGEANLPPGRIVNGEKGSVHDVDFGTSDLSDLMINIENDVELAQEEASITEEFDNLDNAVSTENLISLSGDSKVQHFFRKTYGGTSSDYSRRCIRTSDGGYVITGSVYFPSSGDDLLLIKLDQNGGQLWSKTFGGAASDIGYDIIEISGDDLTGNGLVIVGATSSFGESDGDVWLLKTDSSGIEIWNYTYDYDEKEQGLAIVETSDGKFVICGGLKYIDEPSPSTDMLMIMVESTGEEIWNETFGSGGDQIGRDLIVTQDGNLMVIGDSEPFNGIEMITLWKVSTSGNEEWNYTYGSQRMWNMGYRLEQIAGGDIIAFGLRMTMPGTGLDFVLVRVNNGGKEVWTKTYTGGGNSRPFSMTVNKTGVTMVGSSTGFAIGQDDIYVVRADLSGNEKWYTYYGGPNFDGGVEAVPSPYGIYLIGNSQTWGPGSQGIFLLNLTHEGGGSEGKFLSGDLLNGISASGLKEIRYSAEFSSDSCIKIRFSNDLINWFDSSGTPNAFTTLSSGNGRVLLGSLEGFNGRLHYELTFCCDKGVSAKIGSLTLTYVFKPEFGTMETFPFDCGDDEVDWGKIGMDGDIPTGTSFELRIRTGATSEELSGKDYLGPDGTSSTSYSDGDAIRDGHDGQQFIQMKLNLSTSDISITPVIHSLNFTYDRPGDISKPGVTYNTGNIDDLFNFTVSFIDPDDDGPDDVKVEIDGENHTMLPVGPDDIYSDGREYFYESGLTAGEHNYRFFITYDDLLLSSELEKFEVLPGPLFAIEVLSDITTMTADDVLKFSAFGYDRSGNSVEIVPFWEVSGGGTIDQTGNFTSDTVGTWTIYANMTGVSGSANVTVTPGELAAIEVITDIYTITADDAVQLTAVGFDSDGNDIVIDPEWSAEGGGIIDENGLFQGDHPGMWKVYASVGSIQGFEIIEVQPGMLSYIEIDPSEVTLNISENVQFSAAGFDSDGNVVFLDPNWVSSGGGSMHSSGIFTAETPGTWTVYCNYSGVSGEAVVTVNSPVIVDDDDDIGPDDDDTTDKGSMIGPILGIIGALVLIMIVGIVVYFVILKKKEPEPEKVVEPVPEEGIQQTLEQELYQDLYGQQPEPSQMPMTAPVDQGQIQPPQEQPVQEQYPQADDQSISQPEPVEPIPEEGEVVGKQDEILPQVQPEIPEDPVVEQSRIDPPAV